MGVSIGNIGRNLPASASYAPTVQAGAARARAASETSPPRTDALRAQTAGSPFAQAIRPEPGPPQAGFGSGTVSPPGAALEALGRGVRSVREALPTLTERRDEIRERFDGLRELQREAVQAVEATEEAPPEVEAAPPSPPSLAPASLENADSRARSEQARTAPRPDAEANGGFVLRRAEDAAAPQFVDVRV